MKEEEEGALITDPANVVPEIQQNSGFFSVFVQCSLGNLGIISDQSLSLENHVSQPVRSCFFQLKNIAKLRSV